VPASSRALLLPCAHQPISTSPNLIPSNVMLF
jgi:hypothetical protein